MPDAAERIRKCRAHAEQCRAQAELARHSSAKQMFIEVAEKWEQLATEIQQIERISQVQLHQAKREETLR